VAVCALSAVLGVAFGASGLPPARMVLARGFGPSGGPTGRSFSVEGMTFVELSSGHFRMGTDEGSRRGDLLGRMSRIFDLPFGEHPTPGRYGPARWREVDDSFWISTTEVPIGAFRRFAPGHENLPQKRDWGDADALRAVAFTSRHPVCFVSWREATEYGRWLSEKTGYSFRLVREVEWEYACRAGRRERAATCPQEEWIERSWVEGPRVVGGGKPNPWGLHDMNGNVLEWTADRQNEAGTSSFHCAGAGRYGVIRGSNWVDGRELTFVKRFGEAIDDRLVDVGFRLACERHD
jgi:formylglycine-generating enzyme required for sulfatase activity